MSVGDIITYTITVTNTGNVTLNDIVIEDNNATLINNTITTIAPGQSATITATHTITQADLDAGQYENQAAASTTFNGNTIMDLSDDVDPYSPMGPDDPTITYLVQQFSFELKKHGIIISANPNQPMPGEIIKYIFEVYNTGRQTISNIQITDPLLPNITFQSGDVDGDNLLDVDEIWVYYADFTITQSMIDAGFVDNRAFVVGMTPSGTIISDVSDDPNNPTDTDIEGDGEGDDITHTIIPQVEDIQLLKTGVFNDDNNDGVAQEGETINFTFEVINSGNVTITDIQITDSTLGNRSSNSFDLGAGESNSNISAIYTLTAADIAAGYVTVSIASVEGYDPLGNIVTDLSDDPNNPTVIHFTTNGININDISKIDIYPNPASDFIKINHENITINSYKISDISGKLINKTVYPKDDIIWIKDLISGLYLLTIETNKTNITKKFIVK